MFHRSLCIFCVWDFLKSKHFTFIRKMAPCFPASMSLHTSENLPECTHTYLLALTTARWHWSYWKPAVMQKLSWCMQKWGKPTGPGVGGDSQTVLPLKDGICFLCWEFSVQAHLVTHLFSSAPQTSVSALHVLGPLYVNFRDMPCHLYASRSPWQVSKFTNRFSHENKDCGTFK